MSNKWNYYFQFEAFIVVLIVSPIKKLMMNAVLCFYGVLIIFRKNDNESKIIL